MYLKFVDLFLNYLWDVKVIYIDIKENCRCIDCFCNGYYFCKFNM